MHLLIWTLFTILLLIIAVNPWLDLAALACCLCCCLATWPTRSPAHAPFRVQPPPRHPVPARR
jgi:hypothetical protein